MHRTLGIFAGLAASALAFAAPAQAEQMRIDGYYPAGNDEAASLRSILVEDFSGDDGPILSLQVADALREVRVDGRPWLSVLVGRFGRDAEAALTGTVRTRFVEDDITLRRSVCTAYDEYDNCLSRADQDVPCLRVAAYVRPDLRLARRGGQLLWSFSQESSRSADYCQGYDERPDLEGPIETMLGEFARTIRYQLAPAHEGRSVRVMEGRGDLPRPLRDPYRAAMRQVERDPAAACAGFAALLPQAPTHHQLVFNNGLCAEQRGDYAEAERVYQQLASGRGAAREGRDGLARLALYRRARAQMDRRGQ